MSDPCEVQGDQTMADHIASQYAGRMTYLGNDLLHGTLTLDAFHERMQDAIRLSLLHQAIAGTADNDERELTMADQARIETNIAEQYQFLDGFMADIEAAIEKDGASLNFIPDRAAMYAGSGEAEYWQQSINVDLPAYPRDGSTQCLYRCQCNWRLECDDQGNVLAYWELGEADHCPDCEQRSEEWAPLVIAGGG